MELFYFYEKIIAYKTALNVYFLKILGQHRTKLVRKVRCQIFRQIA